MTMLPALIERLENAEEGSRALDAMVWAAILPPNGLGLDGLKYLDSVNFRYEPEDDGTVRMFADCDMGSAYFRCGRAARPSPNYTTSLDVAMTLVPEGWSVSHAYWGRECSDFTLSMGVGTYAQGHSGKDTPALALAAAALKARLADGWAA